MPSFVVTLCVCVCVCVNNQWMDWTQPETVDIVISGLNTVAKANWLLCKEFRVRTTVCYNNLHDVRNHITEIPKGLYEAVLH